MSFPSIDKSVFFTLSNHSLIFCNIYLLYLINAKNEITEPRTQPKYTLPNRKAFAIHNLSIIGLLKKRTYKRSSYVYKKSSKTSHTKNCYNSVYLYYFESSMSCLVIRCQICYFAPLIHYILVSHIGSLIHQSSFAKQTDPNDIYGSPDSLGILNFEFRIPSEAPGLS